MRCRPLYILLLSGVLACCTLVLVMRYSKEMVVNQDTQRALQDMPEVFMRESKESPKSPPNPIPPDDVLANMSHKDLQAFYHSYINSPQVTCSRVERKGKLTDGGWEHCEDPLYAPPRKDCLVYSYGIKFDFSYDDDMEDYGCEVHAFDPSMKSPPGLRKSRIFFHPTGLGPKNETIRGPDGVKWFLYTLGSHRKMLHHTPDKRQLDVVKMDIEGYELTALNEALIEGSLDDVRQLSFETHLFHTETDPNREKYLQFLALLRAVYDHGFRIYMTHRNYVWSAFISALSRGKKRASCHEVHTVNINLKNDVKDQGQSLTINAGQEPDDPVGEKRRNERLQEQMKLIAEENEWYKREFPSIVQPKDAIGLITKNLNKISNNMA